MRVGVVFPSTEIGVDPGVVRDYTQTAESLGFHHLHAWEHVLGPKIGSRPQWNGPWNESHEFPEPMTLLSWMAAVTTRLELVTGVLVLPMRQTPIVAKQAAQIAILSGNRLRLGVGAGNQEFEFQALGWPYHRRGRRLDEQIALLRELWTRPTLSFAGEFEQLDNLGINPRPSTMIPIWVGGSSPAAMSRVARLGDGWVGRGRPSEAIDAIRQMRVEAVDNGRDADLIGFDGRIDLNVPAAVRANHPELSSVDRGTWMDETLAWKDAGATHVTFNPLFGGLSGAQHIERLQQIAEEIAPLLG
jgi:probable F420-dependent oxidoreductase